MALVPTTCPSCAAELDLDEQYRDWTVRCPECRHEFVPAVPRPVAAPPPPPPRQLDGNPAAACTAAGVGLTVAGVLQLCVCIFIVFFNTAVRPNNPPLNPNPDEEAEEIAAGITVGGLGLVHGALIVLGAVALKRRRNYPLAMAGAVTAVFPCVCCLAAVPLGVWALVVLSRSDTRAAFAAARVIDPSPE